MKLINPLILITLLFTVFSVGADSTAHEIKDEATIIVDNKTYAILLKKCYSPTTIIKPNSIRKENKKPFKGLDPMNITVSCNE